MARKKEAHHGGAWKVAYADFVTAMMALFMVLWIVSQSEEIIQATEYYFKNPYIAFTDRASGMMDKELAGGVKTADTVDPTAKKNEGYLKAIAQDFYRLLNIAEETPDDPVDVEVTAEGLKFTVYDRANKPIFVKDTAQFTEWGEFVVQTLAWLIERHEFKVYIEGHTSQGYEVKNTEYGPWELSSDRANAARRGLEMFAMNPAKVVRVTGFSDTQPLPDQSRDSQSNQRITVSLSLQQGQVPPITKAGAIK